MRGGTMTKNRPDHFDKDNTEEFLSDAEIQNFIRRFEELEREFTAFQAVNDKRILVWLRELVGNDLDLLLQSQERTLSLFRHPNPNFRRAAIHLAVHHWGLQAIVATECEECALSDTDMGVRETSVGALGACYSRTKHERIGHLLATMVRDERQPPQIRIRAYLSLLYV